MSTFSAFSLVYQVIYRFLGKEILGALYLFFLRMQIRSGTHNERSTLNIFPHFFIYFIFFSYSRSTERKISIIKCKVTVSAKMEAPISSKEQEAYNQFVSQSLDVDINTHIRLNGIKRIHPSVLAKDLEALKRCTTLRAATLSMEGIKERWKQLRLFKEVDYVFQPTEDGTTQDVCVHIEVSELPATKSIGIMTTDSAYPEVNVSLDNILGGRYTLQGSCLSPGSRMQAISVSLFSNVPFLGTSAEYFAGHSTEKKNYHLASAEKMFELKAVARNKKGPLSSEFTVGLQRRRLLPVSKRDILGDDVLDFSTRHKGYVRHDVSLSNVEYHTHPYLYNMYPLPIGGSVLQMTNEIAGALMGGDVSFFKSELQASKFWKLGPFFSLHWSARAAGIATDQHRIPINDRLFLGSSHIRGFKSVGPSNLERLTTPSRFAATGGNALWASSLSLSFPFIGIPHNGFAAMHLFANIGNLRMVQSMAQLTDTRKWLRDSACSVGGGIVVTRIPLLGVLPSGRFEVNFALPLGLTRKGDLTFCNGPQELFERLKFGLVWSSQTSL